MGYFFRRYSDSFQFVLKFFFPDFFTILVSHIDFVESEVSQWANFTRKRTSLTFNLSITLCKISAILKMKKILEARYKKER